MNEVLLLWRDLGYYWRSLPQYFRLLLSFAEEGHNERVHLLYEHGVIQRIIDLYLDDLSPWARTEKYRQRSPTLYCLARAAGGGT